MINRRITSASLLAAACSGALTTFVSPLALAQSKPIEELLIIGVRENRTSEGATGLLLNIQETPQSITIVNRELMDNFGADNINDALALATGISVERWETNRTNYLSRGFEIKSTQIDGVGLPNNWGLVEGEVDSYGYEKIEVIRGANGLLTGIGNASGTINYVRKRPLNHAGGEVGVSAGSYDTYRVHADYSTPFTDSGEWAGRVVVASENAGSYLDGMSNDRTFLYAVVDGQLTDRSTLTFGYSYQEAHTDGNMWGGLQYTYADGTQAEWQRSATTAQEWTYWDNIYRAGFVEYAYRLADDWDLKLSYNYRGYESDSAMFFVYSYGLDPATNTGLVGWPGRWPTTDKAEIYEAQLHGNFDLFGETHQLVVGYSHAENDSDQYQHPFAPDEPSYGPLTQGFPYGLSDFPQPAWGNKQFDTATNDTLKRLYAATQLKFGDLGLLLGVNAVDFEREATVLDKPLSESEVSPYAGVTYQFTEQVMGYLSYSDIYQPQDYYDFNRNYLAPTKGKNYEVGVKTNWMDNRLLVNLAVFQAEQQGLGVYAGFDPASGQYFYTGEDINSEGVELEVSGSVNDYTRVVFGYTYVDVENDEGEEAYTWVAQDTVNVAVYSSLPQYDRITLGLAGKWRSATERADGYSGITVKQDAYATVDAFVSWAVDDRSTLQLNVHNLTNEKYITSLYEIGFYAAPATYKLSYTYSF